jgi:hypothetical protein
MSECTSALRSWGIVLPRRNRRWQDFTNRQRAGIVARACMQTTMQVIALRDLVRRPSDEVRGGSKWLWAPVIALNYLGIGPAAYLLVGRIRHTV